MSPPHLEVCLGGCRELTESIQPQTQSLTPYEFMSMFSLFMSGHSAGPSSALPLGQTVCPPREKTLPHSSLYSCRLTQGSHTTYT